MELKSSKGVSIRYHEIFDYKLTKEELVKWQYGKEKIKVSKAWPTSLAKKRLEREKYSKAKLVIAKKVANLISKIPTVKFVGITGALAMNNAGKNSDIDLMIITSQGTLWITRLCIYCLLHTTYYRLRKPRVKNERDALCLNMWLDESDLNWDKSDRNVYTAHEIAQIVPLVNKDKTYERFLWKNKWILNYWPNSIKIKNFKFNKKYELKINNLIKLVEKLAFKLQYYYMKSKITREVVTPTRAIFHPNDWGKVVLKKLKIPYNNSYV